MRPEAAKDTLRVHIRWMIRRDMPEVLDIENASFEFPWGEDDFIRVLRQRNAIGRVAEHDDRIVGVNVYELHKTRLHILNFAVAESHRRRGVGRQMIDDLKRKLSLERRTRLMLQVRDSNLSGQQFFRSRGFRAISILRDYYEDTDEDAYVMQYRIPMQQPAI